MQIVLFDQAFDILVADTSGKPHLQPIRLALFASCTFSGIHDCAFIFRSSFRSETAFLAFSSPAILLRRQSSI
jgi:hypothetical protein